jgi:hypothetical protein
MLPITTIVIHFQEHGIVDPRCHLGNVYGRTRHASSLLVGDKNRDVVDSTNKALESDQMHPHNVVGLAQRSSVRRSDTDRGSCHSASYGSVCLHPTLALVVTLLSSVGDKREQV